MSENIPNLPEIQKTVPKPDPPSHTDEKSKSAAEKEQQLLEKEQSEHKRDQTTRVIFAYGMWALVVVVFVLMISAVFTLGWHTLAPIWLHWLDPDQIQVIKNFVLSGAVVGIGTSYLRRYLDDR